MNGTMIQYFHWYIPTNTLWKEVAEKASYLSSLGITSTWLPPAYKASTGADSVGYDPYDLYDLGEFDQKGTIRTKYGTKEEYISAIKALHTYGIQAIVDIVLNHKAGGDEKEAMQAYRVDWNNREQVTSDVRTIEAYTKFTFPGRNEKYSAFTWDYKCFSGVDQDSITNEKAIFKILNGYGDDWEHLESNELGNYDYLMFNDLDFRNPYLRIELLSWALWYHNVTHFDGLRLDAVKHITPLFYDRALKLLRKVTQQEIFTVGEYWNPDRLDLLLQYLDDTKQEMSLFDSPLHQNFYIASKSVNQYDMSKILEGSLVQASPQHAVTLVDNHDTQPMQSLEAPIEPWFKPLAYALILLREDGYPCVFYPDLYGCSYTDKGHDGQMHTVTLDKVEELETLLVLRKNNAYGLQRDYFDHPNCIGWTREGDEEHQGIAIVMCNGCEGYKYMEIGKRYAGKTFIDVLNKVNVPVYVNKDGWAKFMCAAGSVSVWIEEP